MVFTKRRRVERVKTIGEHPDPLAELSPYYRAGRYRAEVARTEARLLRQGLADTRGLFLRKFVSKQDRCWLRQVFDRARKRRRRDDDLVNTMMRVFVVLR